MQLDIRIVKKHFQKSLDKYSKNAVVQDIMADKLYRALCKKNFENVLEIGAGTGLLTGRLANMNFEMYTANDLVQKSEIYVKKYIPSAEFLCGDFRRINFYRKFDLIASNAVFQWCENLKVVISKCESLLSENGSLAFSTFLPDNYKEFREITGLTLDYKSVDEITDVLNTDFKIISIESFEYRMQFANPLEILLHMKNTGVNSLSSSKWGIKEVRAFCEKYKKVYPDFTLTYNPIIVIAQRAI